MPCGNPGYGPQHLDALHYTQGVRIGDRVEISGQGGWDDKTVFPESLEDEIVQAFDSFPIPTATDAIGDDHTK